MVAVVAEFAADVALAAELISAASAFVSANSAAFLAFSANAALAAASIDDCKEELAEAADSFALLKEFTA